MSWIRVYDDEYIRVYFVENLYKVVHRQSFVENGYTLKDCKCLENIFFISYKRPDFSKINIDYYYMLAYFENCSNVRVINGSEISSETSYVVSTMNLCNYVGKAVLYKTGAVSCSSCVLDWVVSFWYIEVKKGFCCKNFEKIKRIIGG